MTIPAPSSVAALRRKYAQAAGKSPWGEAAAVAVLLDFHPIAGNPRFARHVARDGVDWDALLDDDTWSSGERLLIGTAAGLWRGRRTEVDISRVAFLSDVFLTAWLAIITAGTTGRIPDGWQP